MWRRWLGIILIYTRSHEEQYGVLLATHSRDELIAFFQASVLSLVPTVSPFSACRCHAYCKPAQNPSEYYRIAQRRDSTTIELYDRRLVSILRSHDDRYLLSSSVSDVFLCPCALIQLFLFPDFNSQKESLMHSCFLYCSRRRRTEGSVECKVNLVHRRSS